jgi:hypothetical protein
MAPVFVGGLRSLDKLLLEFNRPNQNDLAMTIDNFPRIRDLAFENFGEDLVLWGDLEWGEM